MSVDEQFPDEGLTTFGEKVSAQVSKPILTTFGEKNEQADPDHIR